VTLCFRPCHSRVLHPTAMARELQTKILFLICVLRLLIVFSYVLRPTSAQPAPLPTFNSPNTTVVFSGSLVQLALMRINSDTAWSIAAFNLSGDFAQAVRVQQHGARMSANEELVAAFDAGLTMSSGGGSMARGEVFTDNGLRWMPRQRVYTPDDMFDWNVLAANTYPAVRGVLCRDGVNQFSVLTGRSIGVSLLAGNGMNLLLHR
jgi:hypothetical protein